MTVIAEPEQPAVVAEDAGESHVEMADLPVDGALEPSVTANTHSDPAPAQPDGPSLDATDAVQSQSEAEAEKKPRRRGWWSLGR